jgi:hypothetical protein
MLQEPLHLPTKIIAMIDAAKLPALYEEAKQALARCEQIDEVAAVANKAAAIASYARQADDPTLENSAKRIRARAVRRMGELLRSYDGRGGNRRSKTGRAHGSGPSRSQVASNAGVSEHKARTAVRIASIAEQDFEALIESENPPGTAFLAQLKTTYPREHVATLTGDALLDIHRRATAGKVIQTLCGLAWETKRCDIDAVIEVLLANEKRLADVQFALSWAMRFKGALDRTGLGGGNTLKLVE